MASQNGYRKPRNKELHDLIWNLPYPVRVKSQKDKVLWQNRAAEEMGDGQGEWVEHPTTWQNNKATLLVPESDANAGILAQVGDLEESLERLKKQQRQTARKKRQAETAQRKREKAAEALEKQTAKLLEKIEQLEAENRELRSAPPQQTAATESSAEVEVLQSRLERLQDDKQTLEVWVEGLEKREAEQEETLAKSRRDLEALQKEYQEYRTRVEEQDEERRLQEQLAEKISEFERLERTLEEEQTAYESEKRQLREKLQQQEEELQQLKVGFGSRSREQKAVPLEQLETLKAELSEVRGELESASRREKRLQTKLENLEQLRDEQNKVLQLLKEDLQESKTQLGTVAEESRAEIGALKSKITDLESTESRLRQDLARSAAPAEPPSDQNLSVSAKNHIDLLKKRLFDTEKKLDASNAELKSEKAKNQSSKESERLAFQDSLTGLPNRNMIERYLQYAHHQAASTGRSIGLFLIDLDGFRVLNSTYGREWGDALLKAVGERLNGMRGGSHLVARHSQDRFMLLAADIERQGAASFVEQASRSLLEALSYPFEVDGESVKMTGSIGVSLGPLQGDHSKELYNLAQVALDASKETGPGRYLLFNEHLSQQLQQETRYRQQMKFAVEKDEFKAVYQPVYNLQKGKVLGVELLTRWQHRDQKVLKPGVFLEPAIKSGLIFRITERLWPASLRRLARWQKLRPGFTLSINLCDKELLSPNLLKRMTEWVREAGVNPSSIIFEVRDQSRVRMSSAWWDILQSYARAGFGLCLDDFGSDSSIVGTLAFHGFRQAKIVVDEKSPRFLPVMQAGRQVLYCAKGLQTKFDKKTLAKAGFDLAQGYAVSRPLDSGDVDALLS